MTLKKRFTLYAAGVIALGAGAILSAPSAEAAPIMASPLSSQGQYHWDISAFFGTGDDQGYSYQDQDWHRDRDHDRDRDRDRGWDHDRDRHDHDRDRHDQDDRWQNQNDNGGYGNGR